MSFKAEDLRFMSDDDVLLGWTREEDGRYAHDKCVIEKTHPIQKSEVYRSEVEDKNIC